MHRLRDIFSNMGGDWTKTKLLPGGNTADTDCESYANLLRDLQLTREFINPSWPAPLIRHLSWPMRAAMDRTRVLVTGSYSRLNHRGHPDANVRRYHVDWFESFADITANLDGTGIGTQFAIMTYHDFDDAARL